MGLYFQQSGRSPFQVGDNSSGAMTKTWYRDHMRMDALDKDSNLALDHWVALPGHGFATLTADVNNSRQSSLEAAIRSWARGIRGPRQEHMAAILQKACWVTTDQRESYRDAWNFADHILRMEEGEGKEVLMARARTAFPRFFKFCEDDVSRCGV